MEINELESHGNHFTASGEYNGKPFTLWFNYDEYTGEVDGDFNDEERLTILTLCEIELEARERVTETV